jgi:hypothetical protein
MKTLTTKQFIWFLIGSGISVALWLHSKYNIAAFPLLLSNWISMSPEERRAPIGKWGVLGLISGLAFMAIIVRLSIVSPQWFPKDPPKFLVHPAVVLPLWLVLVWFVYRNWRSEKRRVATMDQPTTGASAV